MSAWPDLSAFCIVRLDSHVFPVIDAEADLYRACRSEVIEAEVHDPDEVIVLAGDCDALQLINSPLPRAVIDALSACRIISRMGAGTDRIDVEAATRNGIVVTNVPRFCVPEQADHTMLLLLALARKLPRMMAAMRADSFRESTQTAIHNRRLSECVLGLVGFGHTAKATAFRALSFGMRVMATRRSARPADVDGVQMVDLDTLLRTADFISLHIPLTDDTRHLIDAGALAKMKPSACLINTARGAVVDEEALIAALRNGAIAGAGLDVYESVDVFAAGQPGPGVHPLFDLDNVILTPHCASFSMQARQDVTRGGMRNVAAVLQGRWPDRESIVNPDVVPRRPLAD